MKKQWLKPVLLGCLMGNIALAAAETAPDWNAATLTGDWGGARASFYNKGIDLGFTHKSDVFSNTSGGIKRGTVWMGHTEARIGMDLEKLAGWSAASAYIHFHAQHGDKFNRDYVGSFVGVDNIETAENTAQFSQAWLQKSFADDSLSVLAGLYAIDSEFYVTETSGLFTQPPYGMSNDVAQPVLVGPDASAAPNAPAIFPVSALSMRVKYTSPGKNYYVQYALADGVPGDPNNPRGTHVLLDKADGSLSIVELGYTPQSEGKTDEEAASFNKTAIGFWRYSVQFNDLVDAGVLRASEGYYFLSERTLMAEKNHPSQGLSGFVRYGTASPDIHQADWTGSLGLRYLGLFPGRDDDIAGVAVTVSHASQKYQSLKASGSSQSAVEVTYRAQLKPWLALQPTLQYFSNPNMDAALQNALIAGARIEVGL